MLILLQKKKKEKNNIGCVCFGVKVYIYGTVVWKKKVYC